MSKKLRLLFVLAALLGTLPARMMAAPNDSGDLLHRIKHVFVIVLENEGFDVTFGPNSKAPFLSRTLTSEGVLLNQYYGTGHVSLDNYIAMLSGQAATPQTRNDCQVYQDFALTGVTPDGQAIGSGCVYPSSIKTLADQLNAVGKTWRAYAEDMGNDPNRFDEGGLTVQPTSTGISIFAPGLFCCNEQPGPNLAPFPQTTNITPTVSLTFQSYGGDRTGAVLLSPFLEPGTTSFTPFNHYSFLKTLEDIFDTDSYLGYAGAPGLVGFFGCVTSDIQTKGASQSQACGLR